jgi:hypothetical protein
MRRKLSESEIEALEAIEFPPYVSDNLCVLAVQEVRGYILEKSEGSKEEMWAELVLDTDSPSPGREACRTKGHVAKYRDWWWKRIVVPGLRVVSDVEPATDEKTNWRRIEPDSISHPAYCSICGAELSNPDFALNYPNFVCGDCESRAVNTDGDTPWHGWPPGEKPEAKSGTILMTPDQGENPVFIDGIKCWRRYNFGGYITLRDTFNSDTVAEFFDTHKRDEGYLQIFNSPNSPPDCSNRDRFLVLQVDHDEFQLHAWGMLLAESGEIITRNEIAEQAFGPFEEFLDLTEGHAGGEEYFEQAITDPTWMLSVYYSFGAQAHKPKVWCLVPEIKRPIMGLTGIIEIGALRGLREHDVSQSIFEMGLRSADECSALYDEPVKTEQTQISLDDFDKTKKPSEPEGSTLTVRYELPYLKGSKQVEKKSIQIARSVVRKVVSATDGTDYTYLTSLPAVDIHAYRNQREVVTIAFDQDAVQETSWNEISGHPGEIIDLAKTFTSLA